MKKFSISDIIFFINDNLIFISYRNLNIGMIDYEKNAKIYGNIFT